MNKCVINCAIVAATAGSTFADVTMRFVDRGPGRNVEVTLGGDSRDVFAGQLIHEISLATGCAEGLDGQVVTFCAEIEQTTSGNFAEYTCDILGNTTIPSADSFAAARTQAVLDAAVQHFATASDGAATENQAAAFQILIWEIIYDYNPLVGISSINPTSGNLIVNRANGDPLWNGVSSLISSFATAIGSESGSQQFLLLTNGNKQDQIVPVPAPGAVALIGLAGLAAIRRRR